MAKPTDSFILASNDKVDAILNFFWTFHGDTITEYDFGLRFKRKIYNGTFHGGIGTSMFTMEYYDQVLYLKSLNKTKLFVKYFTQVVDLLSNASNLPREEGQAFVCVNDKIPITRNIHHLLGAATSTLRKTENKFAAICTIAIINQETIGTSISKVLNTMLENKKYSDVTINVQGVEFPALKIFLTTTSPVFNAMFDNEMEESKTNQVFITDVSHDAFKEVLRFIYTGNVENLEALASELLGAADKYALEDLKKICEDTLVKNISLENVCEILQIAHLHSANNLKLAAIQCISNNAEKVIQLSSWRSLAKDNPELVCDLYQHLAVNRIPSPS